jgi:hypothetical protein
MCGFVIVVGLVITLIECQHRGDSYTEYELTKTQKKYSEDGQHEASDEETTQI